MIFLFNYNKTLSILPILDSIVVSIPACHAGGRGSIPRRGDIFFTYLLGIFLYIVDVIMAHLFEYGPKKYFFLL